MARLSGPAVLLIVVVPLCMYTCALLVGVQLGRAIERRPDSLSISLTFEGAAQYVAKAKGLWESNGRAGRDSVRRDGPFDLVAGDTPHVQRPLQPDPVDHSRPEVDLQSSTDHKSEKYVRTNHYSPRGVISMGPWGGYGGQPFYMRGRSAPRLHSITLYHSTGAIHSLACDYTQTGPGDAAKRTAGPWGRPHSFGSRAVRATINLSGDERLTVVEGMIGGFHNVHGAVITSLTFRTSKGRAYGPYGDGDKDMSSGAHFSVPVADGACIVGFWGRAGWLLDAIGVYVRPCSSSNHPAHKQHPYGYASAGDPESTARSYK